MKLISSLCIAAALATAGTATVAQAQRMVTKPYYAGNTANSSVTDQKAANKALEALDKAIDEALKAIADCKVEAHAAAKKKIDAQLAELKKHYRKNGSDRTTDPTGIDAYVEEQKRALRETEQGKTKRPRKIGESERYTRDFPGEGTDLADVLDRVARWKYLTLQWPTNAEGLPGECPKEFMFPEYYDLGKKRTAAERAKQMRPETKSEKGARERAEEEAKRRKNLPELGEGG